MNCRCARLLVALCGLWGTVHSGQAAVSSEEAAKLKTVLTPLGAERGGNKEGTIPTWDGGYTKVPAGYQSGTAPPDPFADEKPLYSISTKNMAQYSDRLSEGVKALLSKYPDSFRLDVYPTHRTAAAPQWVYDNTLRNATTAKTIKDGYGFEGASGGIPFPIPKDGLEAIWNVEFLWKGVSYYYPAKSYAVTTAGEAILVAWVRNWEQS